MQMILPERLRQDRYRNRFFPGWRSANEFVILDNGMFENGMMSNENLIELADRWEPNELVMPDVRGNMEATLAATDKFLNMFEQIQLHKLNPSLMLVVQIAYRHQITEFILRALELYYVGHAVTNPLTFGIPRRLAETLNPDIRIEIAREILERSPGAKIHLLGYARTASDHRVFNEVAILKDDVRSIDTDAPFVWAYNGARMDVDPTPFERPLGYEQLTGVSDKLMTWNVKQLDRWANA